MKESIKRLEALIKIFGDIFYTVNLDERGGVSTMCHFNTDIVVLAKKYKFSGGIEDDGFIRMYRGKYRFVLT